MMHTISVRVPTQGCTCPIWVGQGILHSLPTLFDRRDYSQVVLVSDAGAKRVGAVVQKSLGIDAARILALEGGERCKTMQMMERIWHFFAEQRLDRHALVVVVGGGATSDVVGFAAATFMRGIACIVIPSTLLAQVDACIGGKTGVNFAGVKNLIGCTKQPDGIVVDVDALSDLPERDLRSGFAEIVKHGLIADSTYFSQVTSRSCTAWSSEELVDIIHASCLIKAHVVENDEREESLRKTLNFGHTLGHAVESNSMETKTLLTHGEAVSIGMHAASLISHRLGLLRDDEVSSIVLALQTVGLPTRLSEPIKAEKLLAAMSLDKKNIAGRNRWTLLTQIGHAVVDQDVPTEVVVQTIQEIQPQ